MSTVTDLPTLKADKYFSVAENQNIETTFRLKHYFYGLKFSIANSLDIRKSTITWESIKDELSNNEDTQDNEKGYKEALKYLAYLIYECDFLGTNYKREVDNISVFHGLNVKSNFIEKANNILSEVLEPEKNDTNNETFNIEQFNRAAAREAALQATRNEWVPKLKYRAFLPANGFQALLHNAFPDHDPAEYISEFIQSFYQPKKISRNSPKLKLDHKSIFCGEQWFSLLFDIADWCCTNKKPRSLTYQVIKYIVSGWKEDDESITHLDLCYSISLCENQLLYKSAISRIADTGSPDLSIVSETTTPDNNAQDPYYLLGLLYLPIFISTEMHSQLDEYLGITNNAQDTIDLYKNAKESKKIDPNIQGNFRSLRCWLTALKINHRIIFDGEFMLSCSKHICNTYASIASLEIYEDEQFLALYWDCLNKGYTKFRHIYHDSNCDISIFCASDIYRYQTEIEDASVKNPELAFFMGSISDISCNMNAISYHEEPFTKLDDLINEMTIDNPWRYGSGDKYIKSEPYIRWYKYKTIIKKLNHEGLHKASDAFLAFYIVMEGFVFSGTYPEWNELRLIINDQLKKKSHYTKQSIAWINQYLVENKNTWEAIRFDQFNEDDENYDIEISEVINSLLDTIKLSPEEDVIKKIGRERLGSLNPEGKDMILNCHRQYNQLKAYIEFGTMTDLGGLVIEFFRFMENQLSNKLLSIYMADSYRNWKYSNKQYGTWSNKPTMRSFLFFLDDVAARRVPPDIVKSVDRQVSFHTNKKFLSKLHKLHKDYRNDPAHGVTLSQEQFLEFWGKLYTDEFMLCFIDYLQPSLEP